MVYEKIPSTNMCKNCCFTETGTIKCTRPKELDDDADNCAFEFIFIEEAQGEQNE
jgi:hypothetical protein